MITGFSELRDPPMVGAAVSALAGGHAVVVVDDMRCDGDAHVMFSADKATTHLMAFMVRHTSGFVSVALDAATCDRLHLPPMPFVDHDRTGSAPTVTVDAAHGVTTGISAKDRARTARALADPAANASHFTRPGHIQPLRAHPGGVAARAGLVEAAVDLARLAGSTPAAVLCEIVSVRDPRRMACAAEAREFADQHRLASVTLSALAQYERSLC